MADKDLKLKLKYKSRVEGEPPKQFTCLVDRKVADNFKDATFVQTVGSTLTAMKCKETDVIKFFLNILEDGSQEVCMAWHQAEDNAFHSAEITSPPRKKQAAQGDQQGDICSKMTSLSPFRGIVEEGHDIENPSNHVPKDLPPTHTATRKSLFSSTTNQENVGVGSRRMYAEEIDLSDDIVALDDNPPDDIVAVGDSPQEVCEKPVLLDSPEGTREFLKALLNARTAFESRNHSPALLRVQADLEERKIYASTGDLSKKRRSLLDQYKKRVLRGATDWIYFLPCAVLHKDRDESVLNNTPFQINKLSDTVTENVVPKATEVYEDVVFPKVALWNREATSALIEEYGAIKECFDEVGRHSHLWARISRSLFSKNNRYVFSAHQCERKMSELSKKYKDIEDAMNQSGAAARTPMMEWPFYEEMARVKEGDVSVRPAITVAVGSSVQSVGTPTVEPRYGKWRSAPKKRSPAGNRPNYAEALQSIAAAMERRNDLVEKSLQRKE